ncbi:MAG: hypothetical protein J2P18_16705 [Nocardia sp.]|nr:hypothetical protein [Nocardia sp.]
MMALAAVAVVVVLVAVGVAKLLSGSSDRPERPAAAPGPTGASPGLSGPTAVPCPAEHHDGLVVGNGAGDTVDGPEAILGFEHAYYTDRSGELARRFVAADTANVTDAAGLQRAIDSQIPAGTGYCVRITTRDPQFFDVDVDEYRPDGRHQTYRQSVRTVDRDGRTLLYQILAR